MSIHATVRDSNVGPTNYSEELCQWSQGICRAEEQLHILRPGLAEEDHVPEREVTLGVRAEGLGCTGNLCEWEYVTYV